MVASSNSHLLQNETVEMVNDGARILKCQGVNIFYADKISTNITRQKSSEYQQTAAKWPLYLLKLGAMS